MPRYLRIILFGTLGFLWWNAVQAPALYGNDHARSYLRQAAARFDARAPQPGAAGQVRFRTLFAAPANTLVKGEERYFLFIPDEDGRAVPAAVERDQRWRVCRGPVTSELAQRIVFASGSPFPIFPAHSVANDRESGLDPACPEFEEQLVDGGFAHNTPVEAAGLLGARQVLIVHSSNPALRPLELGGLPAELATLRSVEARTDRCGQRLRGALVCNLTRLLPFLFERAQQTDQRSREGLMVVSLAPSAPVGDWPKLFDFRRATVERMRQEARRDLTRRIARVESWGPAPRSELRRPPSVAQPVTPPAGGW